MSDNNDIPSSADTGSIIIGLMSLVVVFYRIIVLMIPMFSQAIRDRNFKQIFESLTLLV